MKLIHGIYMYGAFQRAAPCRRSTSTGLKWTGPGAHRGPMLPKAPLRRDGMVRSRRGKSQEEFGEHPCR